MPRPNLKMSMHSNCLRILHQQTRPISSKNTKNIPAGAKNHYDSLGVTAKSTQADIKSAYYKLSMLHHPDKNKDNVASTEIFRDITAAYEVLGNVKSRKLYDRGLLLDKRPTSTVYEEPVNKFYKSREVRSRPPTMYRETIYDFDQWTKAHYGSTFAKNLQQKVNAQRVKKWAKEEKINNQEYTVFVVVFGFLAILYMIGQEDNDVPVVGRSKQKNDR